MKFLFLIFSIPFLCSCRSLPGSSPQSLPVIASPARAIVWGAPSVTKTPSGYVMTYTNPSNTQEKISITGSRKMLFGLNYPPNIKGQQRSGGSVIETSTPQLWKNATIAGQEVYWYQTYYPRESRLACFRTLGAEIKSPQGIIGNYAIAIEGRNDQVLPWLSELRFVN